MSKEKPDRGYTIWLIVAAAIFFVLHRYMGVNLFLSILIIAVIGVIIGTVKELSKKDRQED